MSYRQIRSQVRGLCRDHEQLLLQLQAAAKQPGNPSGQASARLLRYYEKPIRRAIRDCGPAGSRLRWLFSTREQKQRVYSACSYLFDALMLGIGPAAGQLRSQGASDFLSGEQENGCGI